MIKDIIAVVENADMASAFLLTVGRFALSKGAFLELSR